MSKLNKDNLASYSEYNQVKIVFDGLQYEDVLLQLIREAREIIHFQVYILDADEFGLKVIQVLKEAVTRGVKVYLLLDYFGSNHLASEIIEDLQKSRIIFVWFNPPSFLNLLRLGRRLHHKVLVVDEEIVLTGGINIVHPYLDKFSNYPRLDFALLIKGELPEQISQYCLEVFHRQYRHSLRLHSPKKKRVENLSKKCLVRFRVNDWARGRKEIDKSYRQAIKDANHSIIIVSSYFLPRKSFLRALVKARKRGVTVKIVLPKFSDWKSWKWATEYLYSYLLSHEIELFEWNKSILHAKITVIDEEWSTIGSYNLNYTSYFGNLELNIDVHNKEVAQELVVDLNAIINQGCRQICESDPDYARWYTLAYMRNFFFYYVIRVISIFSVILLFRSYSSDAQKKENLLFPQP